MWRKIITTIDIDTLYEWANTVIKEINLTKQKEKKESDKKGIMGNLFGGFFGKKVEKNDSALTKEEEEKIDLVLNNSFQGQILSQKKEISNLNFDFEFKVNKGSLKLIQNQENNIKLAEGIEISYNNIIFTVNKINKVYKIEKFLQNICLNIFTTVNNDKITIPITFLEKEINQETNLYEIKFILNPPEDEVNSILSIQCVNIIILNV